MSNLNHTVFNNPLPSDETAERTILGAIIVENNLMAEAVEQLSANDFYLPLNQKLYAAMLTLFNQNKAIDPVLVHELVKPIDGGVSVISNLMLGLPRFSSVANYLEIVKDNSIKRALIKKCADIQSEAFKTDLKTSELIDYSEQSIYALRASKESQMKSVGDLAKTRSKEIKEIQKTGKTIIGLPTGFAEIDHATNGLQPGKNIVIAGRPSMGKSCIALNIADNITKLTPKSVAVYFSMEMTETELTDRLLCSKASVDSHRFSLGLLTRDESLRLKIAFDELQEQKIFILDKPRMTTIEMRAALTRIVSREGRVDLVIADHLTIMGSDPTRKFEGTFQEISRNAQSFKPLAKEFKTTTMPLSQLNRECEKRNPPRPILSDLRSTGDIEQEADTVVLLYREEYYKPSGGNQGKAEAIIAKNRGGRTGTSNLNFIGEFTRFENEFAY